MGANEFKGLSDLDFQNTHSASMLNILLKMGLISIFPHFFSLGRGKVAKKVWVLAPTTLKSMGAEAPTAPILTGALCRVIRYRAE